MPGLPADVSAFLRSVEREFDGRLREPLSADTPFKALDDWDSLQALMVVAGLERDFGVTLSAAELAGAETLHDLYLTLVRHIER